MNLRQEETVSAFVTVKEFDEEHFVVMSTRKGMIKKTPLKDFSNPRKGGIKGINLREGDSLIDARISEGNNDILLGTSNGMAIRFNEKDVRPMGRTAAGVRGVKLNPEDVVIGMVIIKRAGTVLVVSTNGYGKRTGLSGYRITRRAGKGIITMKTTEKIGKLLAIMEVVDGDDLMIITGKGIIIRQHVDSISTIGRNTQGVRLIRLKENEYVSDVAKVVPQDDEEKLNAETTNEKDEKEKSKEGERGIRTCYTRA